MKHLFLIGLISLVVISLVLTAGPVAAQQEPAPATETTVEAPTPEPATPEPTPEPATPEPTPTVQTAEPTPTASPTCADAFEPNDQPGSGEVLLANQPLTGLTLAPSGDVDFFSLWVKAGRYYQLDTATREGVDTRLRLFDESGRLLAENDDDVAGTLTSRLKFQAGADGWLFVAVDSVVPLDWQCRRYNLVLTDALAPTPTPTNTPKPAGTAQSTSASAPDSTSVPEMFDAYEPNYDFPTAADLGVNQVAALNFHVFPPGHGGSDNDFFRLYVKVGQQLQIETLALGPGVDTNLILYRADQSVISGNDDCAPGNQASCLSWDPDYTGIAYILVGPVGLTPRGVSAEALGYELSITDLAGQPTPTPPAGPVYGEPLPWPQELPLPGETQTPEPTPEPRLQVQTFSLAPPTPTPLPLQAIIAQLTVYYDENDNQAPDLGEGVTGLNLQVLDSLTNRVLGQTFTGSEGHATLFVSATQEVRLTVPYLGYSQPVKPPGGAFEIRIPAIHLPSLIP